MSFFSRQTAVKFEIEKERQQFIRRDNPVGKNKSITCLASKKTKSKLDTLEFIILRQQSKILLCLDFSRVYMISTNCMNSPSAYLDNGRYFRYFMLIPTHHRFSFTIYIYIYKHKKQCQIYSNLLFSAVIVSCYICAWIYNQVF